MPDGRDPPEDSPSDVLLRAVARVETVGAPDREPAVGETLAHFRIRSRLGQGGMGVVFAADDENLRRTVALKVLPRVGDEARRIRFVREARSAAAVSHPNIATIYEVGESGGRPFIAMEYVRGKTLRARMDEGRLGAAEVMRIAREIVRGVAAAHAAGIVHRDLKPDNVMIADDGAVKVLDFGLAKSGVAAAASEEHETATASVTVEGQVLGTPSYMSPEQAKGKPVDARSDVFSLGVVLYEMATGRRAFRGDSTVEILISIDRDAPEAPRSVDPHVSPVLEQVILRCLQKVPGDRFADAGELLWALESQAAAKPARTRWPVVAFVLAVVVVAAPTAIRMGAGTTAAGQAASSAESSVAPGAAASAGAVPSATALNALPPPRSSRPEAVAAFQAGMQALRDEMYMEAVASWEHAVELDPGLAAAHLRLGIFKRWYHSPQEGRKSFLEAVKNRASLSERDQVLLDAAEPCVAREPYDLPEAEKRFRAAIARYPGDAEFYVWLGAVYADQGAVERFGPLLDRIAELDPGSAYVWDGRAMTHAYLGDAKGARESFDRCRAVAPTRAGCVMDGERILDSEGACAELETMARGWIAASPDEPRPQQLLAQLLLAKGTDLEAVREAYAQAWSHLPPDGRAESTLWDELDVDVFTGDFPAAEAKLRKLGATDRGPGVLARLRDLYVEMGRAQGARAIADDFLRRRPAWPPFRAGDDAAMFHDFAGVMLATQLRAGELSRADFVAKRDAWVREVETRTTGFYRAMTWVPEYADPAVTPDDAQEALEVLASRGKLAPWFWFTRAYGAIGRVYELAGRHEEALPYLRRATSLCLRKDPADRLFLGMALEATGDTRGACSAYDEVLRRWGNAKPRSVTADAARARRKALACGS
jgi:serine/threonine-protein kinase